MGAFDDLIPGNSGGNQFADLIPTQAPKTRGAAMNLEPGPRTSAMPTVDAGPSWGDVGVSAAKNFLPSLGKVVVDTVDALVHPVDTAKAIGDVAAGFISKTGRPGNMLRVGDAAPTPEELARRAKVEAGADAVADFYKGRYGSIPALKNTLANDPAGALMDATVVASPARGVPVVGKVIDAVDPIRQTGNALRLGGKYVVEPVASNVLGMSTGAGTQAIRNAGSAGRAGGEAADAFVTNMRGEVPITDTVARARSALSEMRAERNKAYQAGKADLSLDRSTLDFNDIVAAVDDANEIARFKGHSGMSPAVTVEPRAAGVVDEMKGLIKAWNALDPAEYHTPIGGDALKRALGNIRDSTTAHTPERVAADRIYNAVRDEVARQAPGYSKMMEDYSKASTGINETERTFSLGERATGDTAARKLQSVMRNNAQTNWGERARLLDVLAKYDEGLPYAVAGQSLNALAPRGLVARGGMAAMAPSILSNPANALVLPAFSPRIVGETVYLAGKAVGTVDDVTRAYGISPNNLRRAYQAGYVAEQPKNAMRR